MTTSAVRKLVLGCAIATIGLVSTLMLGHRVVRGTRLSASSSTPRSAVITHPDSTDDSVESGTTAGDMADIADVSVVVTTPTTAAVAPIYEPSGAPDQFPDTELSSPGSMSRRTPPAEAESCSVDNGGPNTSRHCEFTAVESGGWAWLKHQRGLPADKYGMRPSGGVDAGIEAYVSVYRAGRFWKGYHIHGYEPDAPECADGTIERGDVVYVDFDQPTGEFDVEGQTVGAGHNWNCSQHGTA